MTFHSYIRPTPYLHPGLNATLINGVESTVDRESGFLMRNSAAPDSGREPDRRLDTARLSRSPSSSEGDADPAIDLLRDWARVEQTKLERTRPLGTWERIAPRLRRD